MERSIRSGPVLSYLERIPEEFVKYAKQERLPPSSYFDFIAEQICQEVEARAKAEGIKNVEHIYGAGNPADEILKTAKKKKVDLIVMGSRGLGRFSQAFMGGVSTKVCNHAHCTCITVK